MAWTISDHDSAAGNLDRVRALVGRLDLDHPDPTYQAGKADQLARAAADLADDLRVLAACRRLRRHLVDDHGRVESPPTARTPTCGPATTATTTTPACPPADPTPTKATSP
jgi:hypothetical protein